MRRLSKMRGWTLGISLWALILVSCQQPAATNGANSPSPNAGQQPARHETGLLDGPSRDLGRDEQAGGHILRKHVGQSEEDLRRRLRREGNITGASTFTDRTTAEHVVGAAIAQSQDQIQSWLRQDRHPNLVLDYDGTEAIGRTMNRGEVHSRPCTHALVVLKYAGANRYYVLTSYPECR
jgi:Bacterial CdiA-CT RNAse A domain